MYCFIMYCFQNNTSLNVTQEIQRNYIKMLRTQQRVKELELKEINSRVSAV